MKKLFSITMLLCSVFFIKPKSETALEMPYDKVVRNARSHGVQFIDFTWSDITGALKEITLPIGRLESALKNDIFFDGSSIKGFTHISESDLRLRADLETFSVSPFKSEMFVSGRLFCEVLDTDGTPYKNCPRNCLKEVLKQAQESGYSCLCGAELEFFLFKKEEETYIPVDELGYCSIQNDVTMKAFTQSLLYALNYLGVNPEKVHHEVAAGQFEVVLQCTDPLTLADRILLTKHIITMMAHQQGLIACFMPKPIVGVNGSGMHIHASMQKDGKNVFYEKDAECNLSPLARSFITGLLDRVPEINVLFNAEINSSKRLVPGYEAPVFLCSGDKNRSAAIRIPEVTREALEATEGAAVRIELRWPDPSCNPYLALSGLFAAGLEGVEQKKAATPLVNKNLYHVTQEELEALHIVTIPSSLQEAVSLFEVSEFAQNLLGAELHARYATLKKEECNNYQQKNPEATVFEITQWELARGM